MSATQAMPRTVVLVEGRSDSLALRALARRRGQPLDAPGLSLVDLDGITNLRRMLMVLRGAHEADAGVRVLGLYDGAEAAYVGRVLHDAGLLDGDDRDPAEVGFFGCERDLEEEVIRAAGVELVLDSLAARGELGRFRVFQGQPAQRPRSIEEQLHRFACTAAGRKARFAADVIDLVPLERAPVPPLRLLDAIAATGRTAGRRAGALGRNRAVSPTVRMLIPITRSFLRMSVAHTILNI